MAEVLDLRGRQPARDRPPVLLDPSGGRARVLAWIGRAVAFVFLLWLIGLVFAGLGLLPSSVLPLGHAIVGPGPAPPALKAMPRLTQPKLLDASGAAGSTTASARLGGPNGARGAAAASGASASGRSGTGNPVTRSVGGLPLTGGHGHGHGHAPVTGNGGSITAGGSGGATTTPTAGSNNGLHTGSSSAPGQTRSQSSPGHTKTSTSAGSSNSSGGNGHQTTTTTTTTTATTPGKSGSAPGHAAGH